MVEFHLTIEQLPPQSRSDSVCDPHRPGISLVVNRVKEIDWRTNIPEITVERPSS